MELRWWCGWVLAAGACGGDGGVVADGGTTTEGVEDTADADATTATGAVVDDTGATPTSSDGTADTGTDTDADTDTDTDTDETTTGEPQPVPGVARVLVRASLGDGAADALYLVDYGAGVAGEPELITGNAQVGPYWGVSPAESFAYFVDEADQRLYYVHLSEDGPGPITPLHQLPAPDAAYDLHAVSDDDTLLAYSVSILGTSNASPMYVAELVDGVVQAPVVVAEDPPPGTMWRWQAQFSPTGGSIAFRSGFGDAPQYYGPAGWVAPIGVDPPEPVMVSELVMSLQGIQSVPTFTPDESAVWFESNRDGTNELYITELSESEPLPTKLHPSLPLSEAVDQAQPSPDGSRLAFHVYDADAWGDLYLLSLEEPVGTPPVAIGPPDVVSSLRGWSADGRWLAFATRADDVYIEDIYLVDVSGPEPSEPVLLSTPGGIVNAQHLSVGFDETSSWAYFIRNIPGETTELFRVDVSGPTLGTPQQFSGDTGLFPSAGELQPGSNGEWLAFTAYSTAHSEFVLLLVDASGEEPHPPLVVSDPRDGHVQIGYWSADETALVYRIDSPGIGRDLDSIYAVDRDAPGEPALLATGVAEVHVF